MTRYLTTLLIAMTLCGCGRRREAPETALQKDESQYVVTILLDLSGSFEELMAEDGKAYEFCLQVIDRYFRDRIGMSDKLIISQISGTERAMLWQGTPIQLRQDFPTASAFRDFLNQKSANAGSNVYESITRTLEYVTSDPAVSDGQARSAVFVLSDFDDNSITSDEWKKQLVESLSRYGQTGGSIGFYYLDQLDVAEWRKIVADAGIRHRCVESEIVGRPLLPSFE